MSSLHDDMMEDHANSMRSSTAEKKVFRVFISQVNQTHVDVLACDEEEAKSKGYKKWRRDHAHSYVCSVEAHQ